MIAGCQDTPICTIKLDTECLGPNSCWLKLALTRENSPIDCLHVKNVVYYTETVA